MLKALRAALDEAAGPVRIEVLARRLGTDPSTVAAMVDHARRRGLLVVPSTDPAPGSCAPAACPSRAHGCRRCPLGGPVAAARGTAASS